MKAWVQRDGDTAPALQGVDVAAPQKSEVRVQIHASGVCGSDLAVMQGRSPVAHYPVILGHEGAGVVEELGPGVEGINVGDHVVVAALTDRASPALRACRVTWRTAVARTRPTPSGE